MRSNARKPHAVALLATLIGAQIWVAGADAQNRPTPGPANAEVTVQRRANLSAQEQVAEGDGIVARGTQIARRIQALLDDARREHDVVRVTCLNDKLTQANANTRTATERANHLRRAADTNDADRRNHEYTVLTVLGQRLRTLEQEANGCLGQDTYETGATRIRTTIEPGTPGEDGTDPTATPILPVVDIPFVPGPASGTG